MESYRMKLGTLYCLLALSVFIFRGDEEEDV